MFRANFLFVYLKTRNFSLQQILYLNKYFKEIQAKLCCTVLSSFVLQTNELISFVFFNINFIVFRFTEECGDLGSWCENFKSNCLTVMYVRTNCRKTCGRCPAKIPGKIHCFKTSWVEILRTSKNDSMFMKLCNFRFLDRF